MELANAARGSTQLLLNEQIAKQTVDLQREYFFDCMSHQHQAVEQQVAAGFGSLHRMAVQLGAMAKCSNQRDDPSRALQDTHKADVPKKDMFIDLINHPKKLVKLARKGINPPVQVPVDLMGGLVGAANCAQNVMLDSFEYQKKFVAIVQKDVVTPLEACYETSLPILQQMTADFAVHWTTLSSVRARLDAQRDKCFAALCALKTRIQKKEDDQDKKKERARQDKIKKQADTAQMLFEAFEVEVGMNKAVFLNFNLDLLPTHLCQLEHLEKERVRVMHEAMVAFTKASNALAAETAARARAMSDAMKDLTQEGQFSECLRRWNMAHGTPPKYLPSVELGLPCMGFDIPKGEFETRQLSCVFQITLECGRNLRAADSNGFSDPYVVFTIHSVEEDGKETLIVDKTKTKTMQKTLDPQWKQIFKFDNHVELLACLMDKDESWRRLVITFDVYDSDYLSSKDFLGTHVLKLEQCDQANSKLQWLTLQSNLQKSKYPATGQLGVVFNFESQSYIEEKTSFQFGRPIGPLTHVELPRYQHPIPKVLEDMKIYLLKEDGHKIVGIFRLAPDSQECEQVKRKLNQEAFESCVDVNCIANLIKVWFRDVPPEDAILGQCSEADLTACKSPAAAGTLVEGMPEGQRKSIFLWLLDLGVCISKEEQVNKMTATNLGIVIGPNLIPPSFGESPSAFAAVCEFYSHAVLWRAATI